MALHLIGLGLDKDTITAVALQKLKKCSKVYLESYTVDFPYSIKDLEKTLNTSITPLNREQTENEFIIKEAKKSDIALLVYGDALSATTHMQLILECQKQNIPYYIYPNASIFTAIAQTGLQLYKFGKPASVPNWKEHTNKPTSFTKIIEENQKTNSHTLLLTDIGLTLQDALRQLQEAKINTERLIVLSRAGTPSQTIYYDTPEKLHKRIVNPPFCLIIPANLHFLEEEALNLLSTD